MGTEAAMDPAVFQLVARFGALGLAAGLGGIGQGIAIGKALEAMGRQPEAINKLRANLLIGLAFIESLVLLTFIMAAVKINS